MTDEIPTQEAIDTKLDSELKSVGNLGGSSNTSQLDVDSDEFKYFDAIRESGIVKSMLNSNEYSVRGREENKIYDTEFLGEETGAVTTFFPIIKRGSTMFNTWYTSANIVAERENFKVSFNNPVLVSKHYGEWKASIGRKFFREENERNQGIGISQSYAEKECKFALRSISFITEVDDRPIIASFEYGYSAKWKEKDLKEYLRLIVSEMGRSGRYEVKKIIDNIPSEVMTIEEFKNISKRGKKAINTAIKERQDENRRRLIANR